MTHPPEIQAEAKRLHEKHGLPLSGDAFDATCRNVERFGLPRKLDAAVRDTDAVIEVHGKTVDSGQWRCECGELFESPYARCCGEEKR